VTTPSIPPAAVDREAELAVLLAEYGALKDEQAKRIDRREYLVYATLAALAAGSAGATKVPAALLLLSAAAVVLGWTHLVTDQKISAVGQYLRDELSPQLSARVGAPVLGWEHTHRSDPRRRQRKRLQLGFDVATFAGPALVSLGVYLTCTRPPVAGWIAAVLLTGAAVVLISQQLTYAGALRRPGTGRRP
jgi:hypothetical protein